MRRCPMDLKHSQTIRAALALTLNLAITFLLAVHVQAADVTCEITSINNAIGTVTARINGTGQNLEFLVAGKELLPRLHAGQRVYANLANHVVSTDGRTVIGRIMNVAPAPKIQNSEANPPLRSGGTAPPGAKVQSVRLPELIGRKAMFRPVRASGSTASHPLSTPELAPYEQSVVAECAIQPAKGQTCESQCSSLTISVGLGVKNVSPTPAAGPITVNLLDYNTQALVRSWTVDEVGANQSKTPGYFRYPWQCFPPGTESVGHPPPTHWLEVVNIGRMPVTIPANATFGP